MRTLLSLLLLVTSAPFLLAQQSATPPADPIATMHAIRAASAEGNAEHWKRLVSEDCLFVEPTGHIQSREWHIPVPRKYAAIKIETELGTITRRDHGDFTVLTYVETTRAKVGENDVNTVVRFTETYQHKPAGWQLISSVETPVFQRVAAKVDPATYSDLLGDYQVAPNIIGTVSRDGDRLLLKGTGWKQAYELVPLGKDRFFVRGFENTEITFVRDEHGRVTHHVSSANGQDLIANKVN